MPQNTIIMVYIYGWSDLKLIACSEYEIDQVFFFSRTNLKPLFLDRFRSTARLRLRFFSFLFFFFAGSGGGVHVHQVQ